jgi:hypothetical protein
MNRNDGSEGGPAVARRYLEPPPELAQSLIHSSQAYSSGWHLARVAEEFLGNALASVLNFQNRVGPIH